MRALIIDDDEDCRQIISLIVETKGFQVYSLPSWTKSIEETIKIEPDIIFLDDWLPGIKGHEICKILKSVSDLVYVPIYLISAVTGLNDVASKCKADGFISKPFDILDIENVLVKVLQSKSQKNKIKEWC